MPENVETPERVVQVALRALEQGRPSAVSGWQNTLLTSMPRFLPRGIAVRLAVRATQQSEQRAARARMVSQASAAK
jgi:hypothetical protein